MDVMVDLETLGRTPGCIVLAIGAVPFTLENGALRSFKFYSAISVMHSRSYGMKEDLETLEWWGKQSSEARTVLAAAHAPAALHPLNVAHNFTAWLESISPAGTGNICMWGNGADFDNAILSSWFKTLSMPTPWEFWNNRCYRTLKNLPGLRGIKLVRSGTYHNALDDAISQAEHAVQLLRRIREAADAEAAPGIAPAPQGESGGERIHQAGAGDGPAGAEDERPRVS